MWDLEHRWKGVTSSFFKKRGDTVKAFGYSLEEREENTKEAETA